MAEDDLGERVAANTTEIANLRTELQRVRDRVHKLESNTSAVGLLRRQVAELSENMPNLARQAAREAIAEMHRDRWRTYRQSLGLMLSAAGVASAITATLFAIFHH